jgi:hypothetical protein
MVSNSFLSNKQYNKRQILGKISSFTKSVKLLFGFNNADLSNFLGITEKEVIQLTQGTSRLSIEHFSVFLAKLNVSFEAVIEDRVDYEAILQQVNRPRSLYVPSRYREHGKSKVRTLLNITSYLKAYKGIPLYQAMLRNFQLCPEAFDNVEAEVNHNLMTEMLEYVFSRGVSNSDLFKMGAFSYDVNKHGRLNKLFKGFRREIDLLEFVCHEKSHLFDQNYRYRIMKFKKNRCVLKITQVDEVAYCLKKRKLGSSKVDLIKAGVVSTIPLYAGFSASKVDIVKSVHWGDPNILYNIEFTNQTH